MKYGIGKTAVQIDPPCNFKNHLMVHVSEPMPFVKQPTDIKHSLQPRLEPIPIVHGQEYIADKIFNHKNVDEDISFSCS